MAFGPSFTYKPRRTAETVRPVTGAFLRIVLLGVLAMVGAGWGIYLYYTHAFRAKPQPHTAPSATSSTEIEVELK